jgi:hypothetical protein
MLLVRGLSGVFVAKQAALPQQGDDMLHETSSPDGESGGMPLKPSAAPGM